MNEVKVNYNLEQVVSIRFGIIRYYEPILNIKIINQLNTDINIDMINIDFCGKEIMVKTKLPYPFVQEVMATGLSYIDLNGRSKFPYALKKGEVFSDSVDINNFCDAIGNNLNRNDDIRIVVYDNEKNKFESKTFKYGDFLEQINISDQKNNN